MSPSLILPFFIALTLMVPQPSLATGSCGLDHVPINLFQIHHSLDEDWNCLYVKTKVEPNYIANGIPSTETHLFQDRSAWSSFDYFRFCPDEDHPEKLVELMDDLHEENLLDYYPWHFRNQSGILFLLIPNISHAMKRLRSIRNNGVYYYSLFDEYHCPDEENPEKRVRRYGNLELSDYERRMETYRFLQQILLRHFEAIEHYSFLPDEFEDLP